MTFPQKFFVLGHDNNSRQVRKANPRFGRLVRFGNDFVVRPKRRVEISFELLAKHADAVLEAISSGAITLAHSSDSYVDPDEFRSLVQAYRGESVPPVLEPATVPAPEVPVEAFAPVETPVEASEPAASLPEATTEPETPPVVVVEEPTATEEPAMALADAEEATPAETETRKHRKGRR